MTPGDLPKSPSRRVFCASIGALTAATLLPGTARVLGAQERLPDPPTLRPTEVTRSEMIPGKVLDFRKLGGFFLLADEKGVYALSALCTHRGCTVHPEGSSGFSCPCHDSAYDFHGEVTQGPAKRHLGHLEVREAKPAGQLLVDVSTFVPPETRL